MHSQRQFLLASGLCLALLATPAHPARAEPAPGPQPQRPLNVLFILVDDLGWTDLGCYGSSFYETPNIDALAAGGMRFSAAYAACPVCSPTRASILTGKYPTRTGITDYIESGGGNQPESWHRNTPLLPAPYVAQLALEEVTLAEAFHEAGYATFFAGKWHLGPQGFWPEDQGFDVNKGGIERGGPYGGDKYFSPYGNARLEDGPAGELLPDRLARETLAFIEAQREQPFFAYLSFYSVHTPLMTTAELRAKYEHKAESAPAERWGQEGARRVREVQRHPVYAGMIESLDSAVGLVLDGLTELGLERDTAVVLMSDNGGLSTSEGHPTSNLPLRGGKGWLYEGGIREPLIVRWPGRTSAGSLASAPVISTDFYPTLLEMAGLPPRPEQHLDGRSFAPLLRGGALPEPRALFWHYPHYGNQGGSPSGAVRLGDHKLIEDLGSGRVELYDLRQDLGEREDLALAQPERARELLARLRGWRERQHALSPRANPNFEAK